MRKRFEYSLFTLLSIVTFLCGLGYASADTSHTPSAVIASPLVDDTLFNTPELCVSDVHRVKPLVDDNHRPAAITMEITDDGSQLAPEILSPATAAPDTISVGDSTILSVSAVDVNGDDLYYTWTTESAEGTVILTEPESSVTEAVFTQAGTYLMEVTISDGSLQVTSSVTVTVQPGGPILPEAHSQTVDVHWGSELEIRLTGAPDGADLTYHIVEGPDKGELTGIGPNLLYTPSTFLGVDQFTFYVNDGDNNSGEATVKINVTNKKPVAHGEELTLLEDGSLDIPLSTTDADGDVLSYQILKYPVHGTIILGASELAYTPEAGFVGMDSITYAVFDGLETSDPATISLNVEAVEDDLTGRTELVRQEDNGCGVCSATDGRNGTAWLLVLSILGLVVSRRYRRHA